MKISSFTSIKPLTSAEIDRLGFKNHDHCQGKKKSPVKCAYCGKTLYFTGVVVNDVVMAWSDNPERCTCEQAAEHWERYDSLKRKAEREQHEKELQLIQQRKISKTTEASGIKKRFLSRDFANFKVNKENKAAYETALDYAQHFKSYADEGKGLYFEGSYGTGKTHLATAIVLNLTQKGVPALLTTSIDLLNDLKRGIGSKNENKLSEIMRLYKNAELLVIDDLGKEQVTSWGIQTFYDIINDRYEQMKPTIITTNFNEENLMKRYSGEISTIEAIISRLHEVNKVVTMAWEDYRDRAQ